MNAVTRIEFSTLSKQVSNILGQAIVAGEYAANSRLPTESQLSEMYGISRTVVREAIKILNAKGLISSNSRSGIMVQSSKVWNLYDNNVLFWLQSADPFKSILKQFLDMRLAIEPQAVSLAAKFATPEVMASIFLAMEGLKESVEIGKDNMNAKLGDFHATMLEASGNRFFSQLQEFVRTAIIINNQSQENQQQACKIIEEYSKLTSLIVNRQPERASRALAYMIESAIAALEEQNTYPPRALG